MPVHPVRRSLSFAAKSGPRLALAALLGLLLSISDGRAQSSHGPSVRFDGYLQLWWVAYQQVENGLRQLGTNDRAAQEASGFALHRARPAVELHHGRHLARLMLRLEDSPPSILDAYVRTPVYGRYAELWAGQMKIPATYEVATPTERLPFLERTRFSDQIVDYSLSRSPALGSPRLYGVKSYLRDMGVALKGNVAIANYFFMIGNGLGANRFVGAADNDEEIEANRLGAHLYALRLSTGNLSDIPFRPSTRAGRVWAARVGGHILYNRHENLVVESGRAVLDLDRRSWSLDGHLELVNRLRIGGLAGRGQVDDDYDRDGKTDYEYGGWEATALANVIPGRLTAGIRYEALTEEHYESGTVDEERQWAFGLARQWGEWARLRVEYERNETKKVGNPDLDDDVFILEFSWLWSVTS